MACSSMALAFTSQNNKSVLFITDYGTPILRSTNPAFTTLFSQAITIEARFKVKQLPTTGKWIGLVSALNTQTNFCSSATDGCLGVHLFLEGENVGLSGGVDHAQAGLIKGGKIKVGQWHHVAGVINGQQTKLYLDGQLVAEGSLANAPVYSTIQSFIFGKGEDTHFGEGLSGWMDEIRFWNVARSSEDINLAKDITVLPTESGLVAYWKLDAPLPVPAASVYHIDSTTRHFSASAASARPGEPGSSDNVIGFSPLGHTSDTINDYPVVVQISADTRPTDPLRPADRVVLGYRIGQNQEFSEIPLTLISGRKYGGQIPAAPMGSKVEYYFKVQDIEGITRQPAGDNWAYSFNVTNLSLDLDGQTGFIKVLSPTDESLGSHFSTSQQTIEFRMKGGQSTSSKAGIISALSSADGNCVLDACQIYSVYLKNGQISFGVGSADTADKTLVGPAINNNAWHHVAVTINGAQVNLIVDGVLAGTKNFSSTINLGAVSSLNFGKMDPAFGGIYYLGSLDEIRLWNLTRSVSEIAAASNQNIDAASQTNLVAYWKLDEDPQDFEVFDSALGDDDEPNHYPGIFSSSGISRGLPSDSSIVTAGSVSAVTSASAAGGGVPSMSGPFSTETVLPGLINLTQIPAGTCSVNAANPAPAVVVSPTVTTWVSGKPLVLDLSCVNIQGDVTYNLNALPQGSYMTGSKLVITKVGPPGTIQNFVITATNGLVTKQVTYRIQVTGNSTPVWLDKPEALIFYEGKPETVSFSARDADFQEALQYQLPLPISLVGLSVDQATGDLKWDGRHNKNQLIETPYTVKDSFNASDVQTLSISIVSKPRLSMSLSIPRIQYVGEPVRLAVNIHNDAFVRSRNNADELNFSTPAWLSSVFFEVKDAAGQVIIPKGPFNETFAIAHGADEPLSGQYASRLIQIPASNFGNVPRDITITAWLEPARIFSEQSVRDENAEIMAKGSFIIKQKVSSGDQLMSFIMNMNALYESDGFDLMLTGISTTYQAQCAQSLYLPQCDYFRGLAYLGQRNYGEAQRYFEKVLDNPNVTVHLKSEVAPILSLLESKLPPSIRPMKDMKVDEGKIFDFIISHVGTTQAAASYAVTGLPQNATFDSLTGEIVFTPAASQVGDHVLNFQLKSGTQNVGTPVSLKIIVVDLNVPPVVGNVANQTMAEGTPSTINFGVTDADAGDTPVCSISGLNAGISVQMTGCRQALLNANFDSAGTYQAKFVADDGHGGKTEKPFTLTVTNTNRQPVAAIENTVNNFATGMPITINLGVSDPDGDQVVCRAWQMPPGLTLNGCATMTGTIPASTPPNSRLSVGMEINEAGSIYAGKSLYFFVGWKTNNVPQLNVTPAQISTFVGIPVQVSLSATDADAADTLAFKIKNSSISSVTGTKINPNIYSLTQTGRTAIWKINPTSDLGGKTLTINFEVTDNWQAVSSTKTVTVKVENQKLARTLEFSPQLPISYDSRLNKGFGLTVGAVAKFTKVLLPSDNVKMIFTDQWVPSMTIVSKGLSQPVTVDTITCTKSDVCAAKVPYRFKSAANLVQKGNHMIEVKVMVGTVEMMSVKHVIDVRN